MARTDYTFPFLEDIASLPPKSADALWGKLALVEAFPGVGSSLVEPALREAFGNSVLKVAALGYDILYERVEERGNGGAVHVLGIVAQRAVQ